MRHSPGVDEVAFDPVPAMPGHVTGGFDIILGAPAEGGTPETR